MTVPRLMAAIDAAPKVRVQFRFGPVAVEKGELRAALRAHFGRYRGESGLCVTADGILKTEPAA